MVARVQVAGRWFAWDDRMRLLQEQFGTTDDVCRPSERHG